MGHSLYVVCVLSCVAHISAKSLLRVDIVDVTPQFLHAKLRIPKHHLYSDHALKIFLLFKKFSCNIHVREICKTCIGNFIALNTQPWRSQWPLGLRRGSANAHLLGLWVRIPLEAWMSVCCGCCVLSGRSLCVRLITHSEESYWLWCVRSWILDNVEALAH